MIPKVRYFVMVMLLIASLGLVYEASMVSARSERPPAKEAVAASSYPPGLEAAWLQRDWDTAITLLETLQQSDSTSPLVEGWLAHAYLQKGMVLRHWGRVAEAEPLFEAALALTPHQTTAEQELAWAKQYQKGQTAYEAGDWVTAINQFAKLWQAEGSYGKVRSLLHSAYYNHGLALQAAGQYEAAQTMFEAAIDLRPDVGEARAALAQAQFAQVDGGALVQDFLNVPVTEKLIVVGLAEQRMKVFERDEVLFDFVVSTGEPGKDTAVGDFEILNKIDVAYASTWNLDMPYWMGIYWSGNLQNGIHSLPIVRDTGYKLWDGYLGQRVSYGCVILSDEDSATLYHWAEVGVPMKIVYSLEAWEQGE